MDILKSTAVRVIGRGYLSSDSKSTATGLDPAITISKNGGAFANPAAGASVMTEIEATGWYYFELAAGDVDTLGPLIIRGTHATMDNIEVAYQVVETVRAANLTQILGTTLTETAGQIAAAFKKFFNVAAPTGTVNSIPDAVPGAAGALPTTDGSKLNQTADLTANQSIACSDKTGFFLAATGADLILKSSTFAAAMAAAIWESLLAGITAVGSIGKLVKDYLDAAISTRHAAGAAVAKSPATLAPADVSGNLPVDVKAYTVQPTVTGATLDADYDAAKTAAQAGDKMDLIDAPNGTAITAIQTALEAAGSSLANILTAIAALPATEPDNSGIADIKTAVESAVYGLSAISDRIPAALSAAGNMQTDVKEINDKGVTDDGSEATPWGPAA
jgi:hypothetical protein